MNHNLHGADFHALAAADALLLVDHVNAGLGVLGDSTGLANLLALAALDADHGLGAGALCDNAQAGQILVKFLIECLGASTDALQTGHALKILLYSKLLHNMYSLFLSSQAVSPQRGSSFMLHTTRWQRYFQIFGRDSLFLFCECIPFVPLCFAGKTWYNESK